MSDEEEVKGLEEEEEISDLRSTEVIDKQRAASDVANAALRAVISQLAPGKLISEICAHGDSFIEQQVTGMFTRKRIDKGIAFPTCVSVNEVVGHYSPFPGESATLNAGDLVKIDLGCHIDGYVGVVAHTVVCPDVEGSVPTQVTGSRADVVLAAKTALDAAINLIRPGNKNSQVTQIIDQVAQDFDVKAVQGVLSHQIKRYVIDGNKVIINREEPDQKVEEYEFEQYEVYGIDIIMSTGEGKPRASEHRTTVYKRAVEQSYRLRMKASRSLFNEINRRFPALPFTIRALEERTARLGITECVNHDLLHSYPVLVERPGDEVAHFKATVFVMPSNTSTVTGLSLPEGIFQSDKEPSDLVKAVLATSSNKKKKKKKTSAKTDA